MPPAVSVSKTFVGAVREPPLHQLRSVVIPVTNGIDEKWSIREPSGR